MRNSCDKKRSFRYRLSRAIHMLLCKDFGCEFRAVFGQGDGDIVVAAIMRQAEHDPQLRAGIAEYWAGTSWVDIPWHKVSERYTSLSDRALSEAAAWLQAEAFWYDTNVRFGQELARRDASNLTYEIIRRENGLEIIEQYHAPSPRAVIKAIRSWRDRTFLGQPYLSLVSEILIRLPDGSIYPVGEGA
ncbi:hypothetical protein D2T29_12590 [Sinirhodobacter populi]|uniref:Uncharacterized protein n=1 Tax=Paenirhodobacter populi TaxID=2306993 RepID=A0A443KCY7_9RHOB|nr:hypothetical protein [Sinirhodobacter populi]RWR30502.1 hypothetical protein D2T29_12590 [Sinirhodobacter populi]